MGELTVGLLRTHGGTAAQARSRAESTLSDVPVPRELLVVRRVVLRADGHGRRAAGAFDDARRVAVNPRTQPVPRDCAAVLFADDAEMLACLTRDALRHRLDAWYWRRLVAPATGVPSALAGAWLAHVRFLPAALAMLAPAEAVAAVVLLDASRAREVRSALLTAFTAASDVATGQGATGQGATDAPWRPWLPADAVPGPPEREALLGTALALHAAPVLARRAPFIAAAARWAATVSPALVAPSCDAAPTPDARPATPVVPSTAASSRRHDGPATVEPSTTAPPTVVAPEPGPPHELLALWPPVATTAGGVRTSLAGAFYLVTAVEWLRLLDLPGRPDHVSGWTAIDLLTRDLLPGADDRDALWPLLAALAGRDETDPPPGVEARAWAHDVADVLREQFARRDLHADILATAGVVTATRTHLDVWFPIDAIDLAARRCGLDRDPGWVPDLARIIAFHFVGGAP
jgi:hypothetical protein